tara:strand:+ start:944 stop:1249 length:306 start_codon:yes stop_codon:yes gene_type:complete
LLKYALIKPYQRIRRHRAIIAAIAENPILAEPFSILAITASLRVLISLELKPKLDQTRERKLADSKPGKLRKAFERFDGTPLANTLSQTAFTVLRTLSIRQ